MPWTAIALSRDVPPEHTRAVRLDGREIVIWRGAGGGLHVWEDRCPHRGMRLSFGFVRGEALNCLYHGWQYGASASCLGIPAHPDLTVPPSIRANAFAAAEAGGMVWTRFDEGDEAPAISAEATVPVASVAVWTEIAPPLQVAVDGGRLFLGSHRTGAGGVVVHGVADSLAARGAAWDWMKAFRQKAEQGLAA